MNSSAHELPFLKRVRDIEKTLSTGLPGEEYQFQMAPAHRPRSSEFSPNDGSYQKAGVLLGLVPFPDYPDQIALLLIERAHGPDVHAGQIAFPGGKQEPDENLITTALRETEEEIGVRPSVWSPLGALSPLFIPPSRFHVHPYLFYLDSIPEVQLNSAEVRQLLVVPLSHFLSSESKGVGQFVSSVGKTVEAPFYQWRQKRIWGATAMIISELCALVDRSAR